MNTKIGKIVVIIVSLIIGIVLGWIACLLFEDCSFLTLEKDVNLIDILAVITDLFIAGIVVWAVEKGLQNKRIEKDIYIAELNSIIDILEPLGDKCAKDTILSYNVTVYNIRRMRKSFIRLWQMIEERNPDFSKKQSKKKEEFINQVRKLDTLLTDSSEYNRVEDSYDCVSLSRGNIYLNSTIKPVIDNTLTSIKEIILRFKIDINNKL